MGKWSSAAVKAELKIKKRVKKQTAMNVVLSRDNNTGSERKQEQKLQKKTACGDREEAEVQAHKSRKYEYSFSDCGLRGARASSLHP